MALIEPSILAAPSPAAAAGAEQCRIILTDTTALLTRPFGAIAPTPGALVAQLATGLRDEDEPASKYARSCALSTSGAIGRPRSPLFATRTLVCRDIN
ncbi:hypothetical protein XH98_17105 [Bradyrhizobium sp. CCBAU 51745]|nr:hypothetical protein [Bradyrhizobium sp. CCBAU 51745]